MRVANIIEEARVGGPQRRIAEVAGRLEPLGIETVVVGPERDSGGFRELLEERGTRYLAMQFERATGGARRLLAYGLSFLPETRRLARVLKEESFDLVHVSGGSWQIKGVIAARWAGLPIVWHLNDTNRPLVVRIVFGLVASCIPTSFVIAGQRVGAYYHLEHRAARQAIFEIQAPVDTRRFNPDLVIPDARLAERDRPVIVLLASVNPDKGVETLVEAAAFVSAAGADAEFWIVGPTHDTQLDYRARIEASIAEHGLGDVVRFFGKTSDPASVLAAADIAVCTSRSEASPMAVWEAMSMARPLVSTDVGDVRSVLAENGAGFVVPVGDARAAADRLVELLRSPELRRTMGRRGREVAQQRLDLESCVTRHVRVYEFTTKSRR